MLREMLSEPSFKLSSPTIYFYDVGIFSPEL